MPPKKRKDAATAQLAATSSTPRSRRGAPADEKPATSAARSTRGTVNTAEPDVQLSVKKKPGRPAKSASAAPAAPAPATSARRGRPPKNQQMNDVNNSAHDETHEEPKQEEKTTTGRGRGRAAKKDADELAAAPAPKPAPKKGRPGPKPAAKSEPEVVEEKTKDAPKKRGRRSTLIPEPVEERPKEAAAEKRGRARRATVGLHSEEKAPEQTEQPRRRGRPPAKSTTTAKEVLAPPARRGRAAAAPVVESPAESAPKRRGRGASKAAEPEQEVQQPKKRGRAAKAAESEPEVEQPKRRGRAATKTTDEEPAPKKRGRPAAAKAELTVTERPQTKKRGRPAQQKAEAPSEPPKKSLKTASAPRKNATRAFEPTESAKKPAEEPKKRGRPAAQKTAATAQTSANVKAGSESAAATKRPGRPPKAVQTPAAGPAKGTKRKAEAAAADEPQPKRRGRPPGSKNKVGDVPTKDKKPAATAAKATAAAKEKPAVAKANPKPKAEASSAVIERDQGTGIAHWLMKAEPESRLENGVDVKFSIDDLKAATEPEAWDGVRNHVAKKNMMSMKKGDLAFFYHSNCKTPGIAGIMEIVEEAAPDESAFDSKHPYYDAKSSREKPTWHCVKVAFRSKFKHPERLTLTALKPLAADGMPLANMQLFRQSRLSVSKVSLNEWKFITSHATREAEDLATEEPVLVEKDVPEAPNGAADAEAGVERAEENKDAEEDDFSGASEHAQPQPDDDQLGLAIGTPKGASALIEASEEPEADTTIADATLVTAQEEGSIVQENGVTTTTTVTRETVLEGPAPDVVDAAEIENDLPSEKDEVEEQELPPSVEYEAQNLSSKQTDGAEQKTVTFESSPPAGSVRSTSLQPRIEDAPEGDAIEITTAGETQPAEEEAAPTSQGPEAITQNVSSSFGTSSGGVPNDENAPPSSFEAHNNHAASADDVDASAMDFEMTGAAPDLSALPPTTQSSGAAYDEAAQKQVLGELATSSITNPEQPQQQVPSFTGFGFGFSNSNGL